MRGKQPGGMASQIKSDMLVIYLTNATSCTLRNTKYPGEKSPFIVPLSLFISPPTIPLHTILVIGRVSLTVEQEDGFLPLQQSHVVVTERCSCSVHLI